MKSKFSTHWKSSKQPRKQRKYRHNAPLHIKQKFLSSHLSKELRKKYHKRNAKVRKGDIVKILRGNFRNKTGEITKVFLKKSKIFVEGANLLKRDGSKAYYPIDPSNVMITQLNLGDKFRKKSLERK